MICKDTSFVDDTDENDIPDLCYTNYDTIQVIQGKIFVFEEEVSRKTIFLFLRHYDFQQSKLIERL